MPGPLPRFAMIAVLIAPLVAVVGGAAAQPIPPAPPRPAAANAPLVQTKPGAPAHHKPDAPARHEASGPVQHGHAKLVPPHHPPAVAPVPAPAPLPEADKTTEPTKGSNTGNPLPRFATLRSDDVNLRTGPGTRYPIDWVYKRRDLPVMIEREFEVWRLIRDPDGVKGWVHQATLAPRRTGVVIGGEQALRSDPRVDASTVARLKPGVIVRLRSCEATSDWCLAQVQDYRGWIKRTEIWGTLPGEAIQ